MGRTTSSRASGLPPFDKYYHYHESVQSPEEDVRMLASVYQQRRGRAPRILREDFCGAFANCCAWVKAGAEREAYGVDLDPEPIAYGHEHYLPQLRADQRARVHTLRRNVLSPRVPVADVICALNFSYYIFKERAVLKRYLRNCLRTLRPKGMLVLDCFGGPHCQEANEEVSTHGKPPFDYFWDQDFFDPVTNEAKFHIHFKRPGEAKRLNVFSYDWRMWSIPELRDLLLEVGFTRVDCLWEGSTEDGEGDGDFKPVERGEECEAWIAYLAAFK